MIIEIIVLLGFLGSIVGFIFFIKHYFKTSKARSHNKKMLLAIESAEDEYASSDKFYHNALVDFLSDVNWGKVVMFTFVIGIAVIIFFTFAAPNTDTSNGNHSNKTSWWIIIILLGALIVTISKVLFYEEV